MTPRSALPILAVLFALATPAAAQDGPAPGSLRWFDSFDADGDGVLTPAEIESAGPAGFARIDRDGSGGITLDEYLADNPDTAEDEVRKTRDRFTVMDRRGDGNGVASQREFIDFGKFIIEIADFDGDGRLSRQEFIDGISAP
jgi:EF hand